MNLRSIRANSPSSEQATPSERSTMEWNIDVAARTGACVLLSGPVDVTEALAYRIHNLSHWRYGAFTVVDCGWAESAVECALFGVSASGGKRGVVQHFQRRHDQGGTILLKEVGRLSAAFQARLADSLLSIRRNWTGSLTRRLIASTSQPLMKRVEDGSFDHCLYYRLNVIHLYVPDTENGQRR